MRGRGKRSNRNGPDSEYSIQVAICQLLDIKDYFSEDDLDL